MLSIYEMSCIFPVDYKRQLKTPKIRCKVLLKCFSIARFRLVQSTKKNKFIKSTDEM